MQYLKNLFTAIKEFFNGTWSDKEKIISDLIKSNSNLKSRLYVSEWQSIQLEDEIEDLNKKYFKYEFYRNRYYNEVRKLEWLQKRYEKLQWRNEVSKE